MYIVSPSEYAVRNSVPKKLFGMVVSVVPNGFLGTVVPFPVPSVYKQTGSSRWLNWGWAATPGGGGGSESGSCLPP